MSKALSPVVPMTEDALYEIAGALEDKVDASMNSLTIFQGRHSEEGLITVVISPFSEGFLIKSSAAST